MPPRKILLVDDDPMLRRIAEMGLRKVGRAEVLSVGSGDEALEVAAREQVDVIVLDMVMPGLDGPTTLTRLRALCPAVASTPVVFLSARSRPCDREQIERLGARGLIEKPFDPLTLFDEIARLVDGASAGPVDGA